MSDRQTVDEALRIAFEHSQAVTDDDPRAAFLLRVGAESTWHALARHFRPDEWVVDVHGETDDVLTIEAAADQLEQKLRD